MTIRLYGVNSHHRHYEPTQQSRLIYSFNSCGVCDSVRTPDGQI